MALNRRSMREIWGYPIILWLFQACAGADTGGKLDRSVTITGGTSAGGSDSGTGSLVASGGKLGTECIAGEERCACYPNGTCNGGLICASNFCVYWGGGTGGTSPSGSTPAGTGGVLGGNSGGSGGQLVGDTGSPGGARAVGGVATGGSSATSSASFWKTATYSATGLPNPSNGNHNAGRNCRQCHDGSTAAPVWMFGGTVYQADGTTPAPSVQVGLNDGTNLYTTYSATNGNFWLAGTGTVNWTAAQVRIRNSKGERAMLGATPAAACNLCHDGTTDPRIAAP